MARSALLKEFEVAPMALGKFVLGTPINTVIEDLQADFTTFHNVDFIFHSDDPLKYDPVISLPDHGIQLRFDAALQRLKLIDVFDLSKQTLRIEETVLNPSAEPPTLRNCMNVLRLAQSSKTRHEHRQIVVEHNGVFFLFPFSDKFRNHFNKQELRQQLLQGEMLFPDGTKPILSNVVIVLKDIDSPGMSKLEPLKAALHPLYGDEVVLERGQGLVIGDIRLAFGDSVQAILLKLGTPCDIYYKVPARSSDEQSSGTDYFYNYFRLGFDIQFDGTKHVVTKFKLHTNSPAHFDFAIYHKCHFAVDLPQLVAPPPASRAPATLPVSDMTASGVVDKQPSAMSPSDSSGAVMEEIALFDEDHPPLGGAAADTFTVRPSTKWSVVKQSLGSALASPVVFHREPTANTSDPFGETLFWSFQDLIFEVMSSGYIATVSMVQHAGDADARAEA